MCPAAIMARTFDLPARAGNEGKVLRLNENAKEYWGLGSNYSFTTSTDPAANAATSTANVDGFDGVVITTTTTGNAQVIQDPTDTTAGNLFIVVNDDDSTDSIDINGDTLQANEGAMYVWDGDDWVKVGTGATPVTTTFDIEATILASSPASAGLAYATDTERFFVWDGSAWYRAPFDLVSEANAADIGFKNPTINSRIGIYPKEDNDIGSISEYRFSHCTIGSNDRSEEGAVSVSDSVFRIYLNGSLQDVVTNFRFREDDTDNTPELETRPIGYDDWYKVHSGNSVRLSVEGTPVVQNYRASIGGNPLRVVVSGGTF